MPRSQAAIKADTRRVRRPPTLPLGRGRRAVVERATTIAGSYDTPVTLRLLHYRLVASHVIANIWSADPRPAWLYAGVYEIQTVPLSVPSSSSMVNVQTSSSPSAGPRLATSSTSGSPPPVGVNSKRNL